MYILLYWSLPIDAHHAEGGHKAMARLALAYLAALRAVSVNAGISQAAFVRPSFAIAARCSRTPRWVATRRFVQ